MEITVCAFADINCKLKVVNKENGEEPLFDNLEGIDFFLIQTYKLFEIALLSCFNCQVFCL